MAQRSQSNAPTTPAFLILIISASFSAAAAAQQQQPSSSYWDLARTVVPQALGEAFSGLGDLAADTGPDDVKPLRIALLRAREALDIFSFAYPNGSAPGQGAAQSSAHRKQDIWDILRRGLDRGYEALGEFQDLAHSGVDYDGEDAKRRLEACLAWRDDFELERKRYAFDEYVAHPADHQMCKHRHASKFFWGYRGTWPLPELSGRDNVLRLLRDAQMAQVADNYTAVARLRHVYQEPDHTRFHLFRKLIRSILAVLDFFPDVLPPAPASRAPDSTPDDAFLGDADCSSSSGGTSSSRQLRMDGTSHLALRGAGSKGVQQVPQVPSGLCDPNSAVGNLRFLFKNLGQVNNKVFAYEFYTSKGRAHRAAKARRACDCSWEALRKWMELVDLPTMVQCLADSLVAGH